MCMLADIMTANQGLSQPKNFCDTAQLLVGCCAVIGKRRLMREFGFFGN